MDNVGDDFDRAGGRRCCSRTPSTPASAATAGQPTSTQPTPAEGARLHQPRPALRCCRETRASLASWTEELRDKSAATDDARKGGEGSGMIETSTKVKDDDEEEKLAANAATTPGSEASAATPRRSR
uniref:DUF834 domain-containing protein n=1 Tax=Oryza meridionalis TaxID=40149 RepID=A0A0E0BWX3_9ORYZ